MTLRTILKSGLAATIALALSACMMNGMAGMDADMDGMSTTASVEVGGAAMYPNRTIVQNAVNSPIHTTLVAAVQAAGLVDPLNSAGPFTVFAPTNAAFEKLPAGTVDTLLMPQNKAMLTKVLSYHVVPGRVNSAQLMQMIRDGGGMARLTTVEGGTLTARMQGNAVVLVDEMGGVSTVTQVDVMQSNGVIHVTDTVSMPN